jgi:hypothetical protein
LEPFELLQPQSPDFLDFDVVVAILFSTGEAMRAADGGVIGAS